MLTRCWFSSNGCPIMQISDMILGVNIIGEKVNAASVIGGFGGVLKNPAGVLGSRAA